MTLTPDFLIGVIVGAFVMAVICIAMGVWAAKG